MSRPRARAARGVTLTRLAGTNTGELIRLRSVAAVRGAAAALTALSGPLRAGRVRPNRAEVVASLCDGVRVAVAAALADLDGDDGGIDHG